MIAITFKIVHKCKHETFKTTTSKEDSMNSDRSSQMASLKKKKKQKS